MEEPVHDQQQHPDRDHADHRLELLAVFGERVEQQHREQEHQRRWPAGRAARRGRSVAAAARRGPIMLAVIAARIRIASSPSRKTIRAELVIVVMALAPSPVSARASSSFSSRSSRVSRISLSGALSATRLARPVVAVGAVPDQSLDFERQLGVEGAQLQLRAELEEAVGGEPRLLGLLVAAGAGRRFELVEGDVDEFVVGFVARVRSTPAGAIRSKLRRCACSAAASSSSCGATETPCWALSTSARSSA